MPLPRKEGHKAKTDFVSVLAEMRRGQVVSDLGDKFNKVIEAVLQTNKKGELAIKFTVLPKSSGGEIVEAELGYSATMKLPHADIRPTTFFVTREGTLTKSDPNQQELEFEKEVADGRD